MLYREIPAMEKLTVNAPSRVYDILLGHGILDSLGAELARRGLADAHRPVAVLTSPRIGSHYFDAVRLSLEKQGIAVDRHQIEQEEPFREIGVFEVAVKLHPEVTATLKVWVVEE